MQEREAGLLSEISLPVRCKPLELALLVPVNVSLPPLLFCLIWHLNNESTNTSMNDRQDSLLRYFACDWRAYKYTATCQMDDPNTSITQLIDQLVDYGCRLGGQQRADNQTVSEAITSKHIDIPRLTHIVQHQHALLVVQ